MSIMEPVSLSFCLLYMVYTSSNSLGGGKSKYTLVRVPSPSHSFVFSSLVCNSGMERWQLWSGIFDFALLVLLQKATREANDNKIEHLWECFVDPNHS